MIKPSEYCNPSEQFAWVHPRESVLILFYVIVDKSIDFRFSSNSIHCDKNENLRFSFNFYSRWFVFWQKRTFRAAHERWHEPKRNQGRKRNWTDRHDAGSSADDERRNEQIHDYQKTSFWKNQSEVENFTFASPLWEAFRRVLHEILFKKINYRFTELRCCFFQFLNILFIKLSSKFDFSKNIRFRIVCAHLFVAK